MKKVFTILLIIFLFLVMLGMFGFIVFLILTNKPKKIESIESLTFTYTNGYAAYSSTRYDLKCDDECYVTVKPYGAYDDDTTTYKISKNKIDELINVFNEYKVVKWDGFKENNKYVLDGDSFSFSLKTKEGITVYASGYVSWPDNYRTVKSKITYLLSDDRVYE